MFTALIRFSLSNRVLVLALAAVLLTVGAYQARQLPVDVIPDLNRPRVVVMVECPGMAPEEIVSVVTTPIETYLNGARGVTALRSNTTAGLVVITIEFDWNMEAIRCRQIVDERLRLITDQLPPGIVPRIAPMGSMMGQIMYLTIWDEKNELSPMEIRSLADWTVRRRILSSGGVSEVLVIGGDLKQYQVLGRIDDMFRHRVTFDDIQEALEGSNRNVTGGFLTDQGPQEILVRSIGRIEEPNELKNLVVKGDSTPPILLHQVADITAAPAPKVGSSGVYIKNPGRYDDQPSQRGADRRKTSRQRYKGNYRTNITHCRGDSTVDQCRVSQCPHCSAVSAESVYRSCRGERRRVPVFRGFSRDVHAFSVSDGFSYNTHYGRGDSAFHFCGVLGFCMVWIFDQHDDARRIGACRGRTRR